LLFGLGFGLVGGFTSGEVELQKRIVPNQGIRRSGRRATLAGLGLGLLSAIAFGLLFFGVQGGPLFGARAGLLFGLIVGPLAALAFGGYACLSHGALRFVLWRSGAIPLNYVRFLNYAAECNFLYRVGGGYRFVHSLWQDYFAANR
jgi:hypothetical protein